MQAGGGPGEAELVGDSDEVAEPAVAHAPLIPENYEKQQSRCWTSGIARCCSGVVTISSFAARPTPLRRGVAEALADIPDGATLMVGGFGLVGAPLTLIDGLITHTAVGGLTVISNNLGEPGRGLGRL